MAHDFAHLEWVERDSPRMLVFGGRLGEPMWVAEPIHDTFQPGHTALVVHHFLEKLLRQTGLRVNAVVNHD